MPKMTSQSTSPRMEQALRALYATPAPSPAFADDLERRLLAQAQALPPRPARSRLPVWLQSPGRRWALAAVAVLLALATALAAVGPQRVWAEVQRLLGYVPGVGFVDLEQTRVLTAPVAVTREGVTLMVDQTLAQPGKTTIVLHAEGLSVNDAGTWDTSGRLEARLRLPDGRLLDPDGLEMRLGWARVEFPPLPVGVYRATLELARLPFVRPGAAPEQWEAPLALRPASGELVAELFPQPYSPEGARDTQAGITLSVLAVAQSRSETAVRLQMQWEDARWSLPDLGICQMLSLRDDLGHVYWPVTNGGESVIIEGSSAGQASEVGAVLVSPEGAATATPASSMQERTYTFAPVSTMARHLSMEVDSIRFYGVSSDAGFTIDLGDDPQVGNHWPLDIRLDAAGFPVHITGASLEEVDSDSPDQPERRVVLQFDVTPLPRQAPGTLTSFSLRDEAGRWSPDGSRSQGLGSERRFVSRLTIPAGQPIPGGVQWLRLLSADVTVDGPWEINWAVPAAGSEQPLAPVTLHPGVRQTRSDVTLQLKDVVLTDRITALTLAQEGAPTGTTLSSVMDWNPFSWQHDLALSDDRGHRYALGMSSRVAWEPKQAPRAGEERLTFGPLAPFAQRLTLHVPAVELAVSGQAAFDVEVPDGLDMAPTSADQPSLRSPSWPVDIQVEVAGYRVRFCEAWLEEVNGTTMLQLLSEPYTPASGDRWLSGLRPATVTGPDGRTQDLRGAPDDLLVERVLSGAGPQPGGKEHWAALAFDVVDPETGQVRPGTYRVELEGVNVAVRGPWELTCDVAGQ